MAKANYNVKIVKLSQKNVFATIGSSKWKGINTYKHTHTHHAYTYKRNTSKMLNIKKVFAVVWERQSI